MSNIYKGLLAGLAATLVLSALMVMKTVMGVMPELDLPKMIAAMMGSPDAPMLGWAIHFMIGIVGYGLGMAFLSDRLPGGSRTVHGVIIGIVGWLLMMVTVMPMAGAGLFGMNMGLMAPMMTLVLHLVFGAVLGWVYGKLLSDASGVVLARA
ncbi:DUF6789 family protein [Hydrogenophaga sp. PAMC20947]|uniref:DUF6789 family protein n=1 Tax=Hydrogenophaga sp. PAMC20947 TaxID=2565558 RepID=UPI00109DB51B|nr:DUF6789 family protein [Hydrogenophaga sp. PAMC20947]QCB45389.1 hypothetical protein E5678_04695 [Hydrogenophaga sp. PAMC20947]